MTLDHILLGILRRPASGYEIKQWFENVFQHFWNAKLSQIYRTLKRLEAQGYLTSEMAPSEQGPDKRVYRITPAGRARVQVWLEQGPEVGNDRHAYLAQLTFLSELKDLRKSLEFMEQLRTRLSQRLAVLRGIDAHWRAEEPGLPDSLDDEQFHLYLTLQMGLSKIGASVKWADDSISQLNKRLERK